MDGLVSRYARDESGATAIEYSLVAALISIVIVAVLTTVGTKLRAKFTTVSSKL